IGTRREIVDRVEAIAVGRPDRPVALFLELLLDERVVPVGRRAKVAPKSGLRVLLPERPVQLPFVTSDDRPVVREQLREEAQPEHGKEDPQADPAAAIRLEAQPGTLAR